MASSNWSNLHPEILSIISKILNTDVDILRIRSVCSSWRYALPPRLRPSPFPLEVPSLSNCSTRFQFSGGRYMLNYTTLYRLSPPETGPRAGDPSDGWLFRVLEVKPNSFTLLSPLVPINANYAPGTVPESLNLLHYRITEICKCYSLTTDGFNTLGPIVKKVVVLSNNDCDFVVLVFFADGTPIRWKYGDKGWAPINTLGYDISDSVVCNGKCYSISDKGVLFSSDSNLELTVIHMPCLPVSFNRTITYLLEYKSDLYLALIIYEETHEDESGDKDIRFRMKIFKKCNGSWKHIKSLKDEVFFSSEDVCIGLPAEDFKSVKGNSVHAAITDLINYDGN